MLVSGLKMVRHISSSQTKKRLPKLIRQVGQDDSVAVAVTDQGIPSAILLVLINTWDLLGRTEILGDRKTIHFLRRSLRQLEKGEWVNHRAI